MSVNFCFFDAFSVDFLRHPPTSGQRHFEKILNLKKQGSCVGVQEGTCGSSEDEGKGGLYGYPETFLKSCLPWALILQRLTGIRQDRFMKMVQI